MERERKIFKWGVNVNLNLINNNDPEVCNSRGVRLF